MKLKTATTILLGGLLLSLMQCSCKDKADSEAKQNSNPKFSPQAETLSTDVVEIGGEKFTLELAFTNEDRRRGFMYRKELPADRGMIFIFAQSIQSPFHMENCLIDLDILFLQADGTIVQITTMKAPPPGEPSRQYYCRNWYRYTIELPAGTAERLKLKVGDKIQITPRIREIIPDSE
jgi:uncharacterized protein